LVNKARITKPGTINKPYDPVYPMREPLAAPNDISNTCDHRIDDVINLKAKCRLSILASNDALTLFLQLQAI